MQFFKSTKQISRLKVNERKVALADRKEYKNSVWLKVYIVGVSIPNAKMGCTILTSPGSRSPSVCAPRSGHTGPAIAHV